MKMRTVVYFDKIFHFDKTFHVCPTYMLRMNINEVYNFLKDIGDEFYIIDDELYVDDGAIFNLTMKYCDKFDIITL